LLVPLPPLLPAAAQKSMRKEAYYLSKETYDVFHLFWDALRKREEKKEKVERSKSAY
jgi:hypothetical protein